MEYLVYLGAFFVFYAALARRDLVWALSLLAALLPSYILRFTLGPIPSTALEGMTLILVATYVYQHRGKLNVGPFFYPGLALIAAALIAVFVAPDFVPALGIYRAYFVEPFLVYLVAINVLRTERDLDLLFRGLGVAVLALSAIAVYQYATGQYLPTWEWTEWATRRATGTFTSPNSLGLFVVPITLWALTRRQDRFAYAVAAAGIVSVLLAWSKGAMVALAICIAVLFYRRINKTIAAGVLAVVASLVLFMPSLRERTINLITLQTPSGQSRLALYDGSFRLLKQHPLTGTGLAAFGKVFETVRPPEFTEKLIYPHNIILNFWLETGLFGLVALIWIIIVATRLVWQQRQHAAVLGIGLALLSMLLHGFVDVPYFKNDLAMLTWMLFAALTLYADRASSSTVIA